MARAFTQLTTKTKPRSLAILSARAKPVIPDRARGHHLRSLSRLLRPRERNNARKSHRRSSILALASAQDVRAGRPVIPERFLPSPLRELERAGEVLRAEFRAGAGEAVRAGRSDREI